MHVTYDRDPINYGNDRFLPPSSSAHHKATVEDVAQVQQQIRSVREESLLSLENTYRTILESHASADRIAAILHEDAQSLDRTEKNLQHGQLLAQVAQDRANVLKKEKRSMFAFSISNPLTASQRKKKEKELQEKTREFAVRRAEEEAMKQDQLRKEAHSSSNGYNPSPTLGQAMSGPFSSDSVSSSFYPNNVGKETLTAEQQLYSFENTDEDDLKEHQINHMLTQRLPGVVSSLREKALTLQAEVQRQNGMLDQQRGTATGLTGEVSHITQQLHYMK
ncbi:Protein transport protein S9 plasma membrane t-SNARE [Actinomortierella wolfii]|nr:Protein transport protein S9 plasma membrane t-SNARE [Actinomortierella wolfii]